MLLLLKYEAKILDGNNKKVVWSAACLISHEFGNGEPTLSEEQTEQMATNCVLDMGFSL